MGKEEYKSSGSFCSSNSDEEEATSDTKSLKLLFKESRIMKRINSDLFFFVVNIKRTVNGDIVKVNAKNLTTNDEFEVNIYPKDLSNNFFECCFERFCVATFNKASTPKFKSVITSLTQSKTKFIRSLVWLKVVLEEALNINDKKPAQNIYQLSYGQLKSFVKFVKYEPEYRLRGNEEIGAIILGIGNDIDTIEYGLQIPKILPMGEELFAPDQSYYLTQYELFYKNKTNDECLDVKSMQEKLTEKIKSLELDCEEVQTMIKDVQSNKK